MSSPSIDASVVLYACAVPALKSSALNAAMAKMSLRIDFLCVA
jgi:hypothetical protein